MKKTIKVNAGLWNETSAEEKKAIKDSLVKSGLIGVSDEIVGDPETREMDDEEIENYVKGLRSEFKDASCEEACGLAYAAANAACSILPPIAGIRKRCQNAAAAAYHACLVACG